MIVSTHDVSMYSKYIWPNVGLGLLLVEIRVPLRLELKNVAFVCHFSPRGGNSMTKKITSFFQVTARNKVTLSGTKRGRDNDNSASVVALRDADDGTAKIDCFSLPRGNKNCRSSPSQDHVNALLSFLCEDTYENVQLGKSSNPLVPAAECNGQQSCCWMNELRKHFQMASFQKLAAFVAKERQIHKIYPPPAFVWSALNSCPLHMVKVVIVGQDPYHGHKQAHGLSFSVEPGCAVPPSLKNMYVNSSLHYMRTMIHVCIGMRFFSRSLLSIILSASKNYRMIQM
jgi:hypothetical protein